MKLKMATNRKLREYLVPSWEGGAISIEHDLKECLSA